MNTLALVLLKDLRVTNGWYGLRWDTRTLHLLPEDECHHACLVAGLKNELVTDWILERSYSLNDWSRDDIATAGLCVDCRSLSPHRHETENGMVCDSCRLNYDVCDRCDSIVADIGWSGASVNGEVWCGSCVENHSFECRNCGYTMPESESYGDGFCEDCYLSCFSYCENCGDYWNLDDSADCENCGGYREGVHCHTFVTLETQIGALSEFERLSASILPDGYSRNALNYVVTHVLADMRQNEPDKFVTYYSVRSIVDELASSTEHYARRLKRSVYKELGHTLSNDTLGVIGSLLSLDLQRSGSFNVTLTRELNGYACEFGNPTSCYYGSSWGYSQSLDIIANHGAYALRDWGSNDANPIGRIWTLPIAVEDYRSQSVYATGHDEYDGLMFFNGYGTLAEKRSAGLITELFGIAPITVQYSYDGIYQNSTNCLLVGTDRLMTELETKSLRIC